PNLGEKLLLTALSSVDISTITTHKYLLKCPPKIYRCTNTFRPVCGSDGITYTNTCTLCLKIQKTKRKIYISNRGTCTFFQYG
uniref:Kazal-like domain-containing protein n=1 Tax=Poecilia reticulata TaxID=8081 RepID=A0A3P9MSY4_POERE